MCGGGHLASLEDGSAKKNGIVQIVAGGVSFLFHIAALIVMTLDGRWWGPWLVVMYSFSGVWCGVFFILGGVFLLLAGVKRNFCWTVTALVFAVINIIFSFTHFWLLFSSLYDSQYPYWYPPSRNWSYSVMVAMLSVMMFAAFAQLFAVFWAVVITSKALHYRSRTPVDDHRNIYTKSNSLLANWVAQLVSTAISVLLTIVILFIVAYGVHPRYPSNQSSLFLQKAGVSLWCAPVYLLNVYLGFRSWRFGENSSLISFLVVNLIQLLLTPWELGASATAIENAWGLELQSALQALHSVIIISAIAHFGFSIWAIVVSSIAAHRGKACTCGGGCCGDGGCCSDSDPAISSTAQPHVVQVVVPTGTTTGASARYYVLVPVDQGQAGAPAPSVAAPVNYVNVSSKSQSKENVYEEPKSA